MPENNEDYEQYDAPDFRLFNMDEDENVLYRSNVTITTNYLEEHKLEYKISIPTLPFGILLRITHNTKSNCIKM